jgi:hypothetical protein
VQVPTFGPAQATVTGNTNFVAAAIVLPADDNLSGSGFECFESDGESGSSFSWTEESSDEGLDYFAALDVAAVESSPRVEVGEAADLPSARTKYRRRRVVSKHSVGDGPCCRSCRPSLCMSAISCSCSRALCSSSRIIWRTLACAVTRWRLASRMSFCFWRLRFLMRRARSCSYSSAEMPMTSPSSVASSPSGGAKPRGGACGSPPELQVRRVPSGVGCSWLYLLLRASPSEASWGCCLQGPCLFFSASSAAFAASSMDGAAFELARLGAIAVDLFVARTVGAKCWYSFR